MPADDVYWSCSAPSWTESTQVSMATGDFIITSAALYLQYFSLLVCVCTRKLLKESQEGNSDKLCASGRTLSVGQPHVGSGRITFQPQHRESVLSDAVR